MSEFTSSDSSSADSEIFACLWRGCSMTFPDPEILYTHLTEFHVGRKSTNNLCLNCSWDDCTVKTIKRDHITSHLRIHIPLKPFVCKKCFKTFKRRQDQKKHEKIHEPHFRKQSLHIPTNIFSYHRSSCSIPVMRSSPVNVPISPCKSVPDFCDAFSPISDYSDNFDLATPIMNIASNDFVDIRAQDVIRYDNFAFGNVNEEQPILGRKRNYDDYDVHSFFNDMKKQRLPAEYNSEMATMLDNVGKFILDDGPDILKQQSEQDKEQFLLFFETLKDQIDLDLAGSPLECQADFGYSLDFSSNDFPSTGTDLGLPGTSPGQPVFEDFSFNEYAIDSQFSAPFGNDNMYSPCMPYPSMNLESNKNTCTEFDIMQLPEDSGIPNDIFPHLDLPQQPELVFDISTGDAISTIPIDESSDNLYPFLDQNSGQLLNPTFEQTPVVINRTFANPLRRGSNTSQTNVEVQDESNTPQLDFNIPQYTAISMFSQMNAPEQDKGQATSLDVTTNGRNREHISATVLRARSVSPAKSSYMGTIQAEKATSARRRLSHGAVSSSSRESTTRDNRITYPRKSEIASKKKFEHLKLVEKIIQICKAPSSRNSQKSAPAKQIADDESSELMERLQARLEAIRLGGKAA